MAQVIKIKRSTGTSAPSTLAVGELAYSKGSDTFYVGDPANANTPIAIGGAIKNNAGTPVLATGVTADEIASLILPAISSSITLGDATDVTFTTSGSVVVTGNLTVNGTTTTVNSTTTTVDDPIFTIGGDSAPGSDDNKDRGIEFRYHTGSAAKVGFFGYDDSASKFTFIPDATNSSEVFSGAVGTILANLEGSLTTGGHTINDIDVAGEFNDVDDHLMTSAAINDRITSFGYGTGDITQVQITAGDGLTGGGTGSSGDVSFTLAVDEVDGGTYT